MAVIEKGFGITHEYEGAKLKHTLKTTTVKEWVGDVDSNITYSPGGDDEYSDVTVAGQNYSNSKINDISYDYAGNQVLKTTVVETKIEPEDDCEGPCGLKKSDFDEYSDSVTFQKGKDSISFTRDITIKISKDSDIVSSPSSPNNSAAMDLAVDCAASAMSDNSGLSSSDPQISKMIDDAKASCGDGGFDSSVNENIDHSNCSVSMSKTVTKNLGACDSDCSSSKSTSVSYDQNGLVSISLSGDIKGEKQDYECDSNGMPIKIIKTKGEYAAECFDLLDLDAMLLEKYEAHSQEACEDDVCLAFKRQSKSKNICEPEGTISWSISASEEELSEANGNKEKIKDKESKNGCLISISRNFEFSVKVKDGFTVPLTPIYLKGDCSAFLDGAGGTTPVAASAALLDLLGGVDMNPPAGFFGPLSMSMTISPEQGSLTGTIAFDNDPAHDPAKITNNGVIKSETKTTTVCPQEFNIDKRVIACGLGATDKISVGGPGSTKVCKDVEVFPCGEAADVIAAVDITSSGLVVEDSFSINVTEGAKTGSACKKWHTDQDLKGVC